MAARAFVQSWEGVARSKDQLGPVNCSAVHEASLLGAWVAETVAKSQKSQSQTSEIPSLGETSANYGGL
jgi:hypothetical protein